MEFTKYVTQTSETISLESFEHRVTGQPVAKAWPRRKLAVTLSPISFSIRERKWIGRFREDCFAVSEAMIRLLRHDPSILREDDGAVRYDDLLEENQGKVRWYFAVVSKCCGNFLAKKDEDQRKGSNTA